MIRLHRRWLMVALAAALQAGLAPRAGAGAAPQADLWARWQAHDPDSSARIDHGAWAGFLARHVDVGADGIDRVAHRRLAPEDRSTLEGDVDGLAELSASSFDARSGPSSARETG